MLLPALLLKNYKIYIIVNSYEGEMVDMKRDGSKNIPESIDFIIVTVIDEACSAVREILDLNGPYEKYGVIYYSGIINNSSIVCLKSPERSNIPCAAFTSDFLRYWRPTYLLVVDIAGGIEGRENILLGDVIVHTHLVYYEFIKETEEEEEKREFDIEPASPRLKNISEYINLKKENWWDFIRVRKPAKSIVRKIESFRDFIRGEKLSEGSINPKVVSGEILCGDKLLADPESPRLRRLLSEYKKAVAVEMESGGIARALYDARRIGPSIEFLVVRGISDYCNKRGNQKTRDKWKKYAANAAAAFSLVIIKNVPKKDKELLPYEQYRIPFEKALQTEFPVPEVTFKLTYSSAQENKIPIENLIKKTLEVKRLILRGPAGGGKSFVLGKLARLLLQNNIIPVFLRLKIWRREYSQALSKLEWDKSDIIIDTLLKVSLIDLNLSMLSTFPSEKLKFIMVDGLNEVSAGEDGEESVRQIVDALDEHVRQTSPYTCVLLTDRLTPRRYLESRWENAALDLLDIEEVKNQIKGRFGEETFEILGENDWKLLQIPYFLDHALKSKSPHLGSEAKAIESFFRDQMKFDEEAMNRLAESAFKAYEAFQSLSFDASNFSDEIGVNVWEKLLCSGVVKTPKNNQTQFDHQLKHDFLASRFLAKNEDKWERASFDVVSFESNSFEPLSMAIEQQPDPLTGDRFLKCVYDWNWLATVTCIARAAWTGTKYYTQEMEIATLSVVSEKLFDKIRETRRRAEKVLYMFPKEIAGSFKEAKSLEDILALVKEFNSTEEWFLNWKELFTRYDSPPLCEHEIQKIEDTDSILGWTASNVIKRFNLSDADLRQLRAIYRSKEGNTAGNDSVRWRVVHTLGAFDTRENMELLLHALDCDSYHWTRFGAARSLVEIAARTKDEGLRSSLIGEIKKRVGCLKRNVMEEIGRAVFYSGAPSSWLGHVFPLLDMARKTQKGKADQERWEETCRDFEVFLKEESD